MILPVIEILAIRAREVEPSTEEGWEDETVDDGVGHDRVHVVWCDTTIPDPGSRGRV